MEMNERKRDRQPFPCHSRRNSGIGHYIFGIHFRDTGKSTPTNLSSSYVEDLSWIYIINELEIHI